MRKRKAGRVGVARGRLPATFDELLSAGTFRGFFVCLFPYMGWKGQRAERVAEGQREKLGDIVARHWELHPLTARCRAMAEG